MIQRTTNFASQQGSEQNAGARHPQATGTATNLGAENTTENGTAGTAHKLLITPPL
jgi:hypothetical protein